MSGEAEGADPLRARNRVLTKKLARAEHRMRTLEAMNEQNGRLLRGLMAELEQERAESERLLLNVLPKPIAAQLKAGPAVIAEAFPSASVLFADIVGFTTLSQALSAEEMVGWLNEVYSAFDARVQAHGVEKIRTIGDNYMVASGLPVPRSDHAAALARFAVDIRDHVASRPPVRGHRLSFRIGLHAGPVVGGVIGTHKFQYDIWGDAVNTAARMESHGVPGRIHVSDAFRALLGPAFRFEARGPTDIKGKGRMQTWFLVDVAPTTG